jgi:hypothetical protein
LLFPADSLALPAFELAYELNSGDLIFAGPNHKNTDDDQWYEYSEMFLVKTTPDGTLIWDHKLEVYDDQFFRVNQIFEMDNGDLLVFGSVYHDWDQIILRVSAEGDSILWKYRWGTEDLNDWLPWGVEEEDGAFTVAYLSAFDQSLIDPDFAIIRPRLMRFEPEDQSVLWEVEYDHIMEGCFVHDLVKTPDGGYAMLGWAYVYPGQTHSYGWLLKTDSVGNEEWFHTYYHVWPEPGDTWIWDELYDLEITPDGGFIAVGQHQDYNDTEPQSTWLLKLDACGEVEWSGCEPVMDATNLAQNPWSFTIFPNPTTEEFSARWSGPQEVYGYELYDLSGRLVYADVVANPSLSSGVITINTQDLAPGIFHFQLVNQNNQALAGAKVVVVGR